jgi:hypothetical protein
VRLLKSARWCSVSQALTRSRSSRVFVLLLVVGVLIAVIGFHFAIGAGLGLSLSPRPDGMLPTGIAYNAADNLSYASWAQQARYTSPINSNLYTTEPHPAAYFNAFFSTLGLLARWSDKPMMGLLNVAGLVGATIAIVAVYQMALLMGLTESAARWSMLFFLTMPGLSYVVRYGYALFNTAQAPNLGADVTYLDAFAASAFLLYPYHAFSIGWLAVVVWLAVVLESRVSVSGRRTPWFLLLGMLTLLLNFVHPYEAPMAVLSYLAYVGMGIARNEPHGPRRIVIALTLAVPTLAGGAYNYWLVRSSPVWDHFARSSLSMPYSRSEWLIGYGLLLPIALVGVVASLSDKHIAKARWMACWTVLLVLLLIVANVKVSKVCMGGPVPLSIMAGAGWTYLVRQFAGWRASRWRPFTYAAGLVVCGLFLAQNLAWAMEALKYQPHAIEAHLAEAAAEIRKVSHVALPTVLCDVSTGSVLPGAAGFRVYAGHRPLTVGFVEKEFQLRAAGFDSAEDTSPAASEAFAKVLKASQANFVLVRTGTSARRFAIAQRGLQLAGSFGRWSVFTVTQE